MSIDLGGFYIFMTEQILDGANVGSGLKHVCRKAMAQRMRRDIIRQAQVADYLFDFSL
jgi:hypothetical protein